MPRKGAAPRRDLLPDPVYRSVVVTQETDRFRRQNLELLAG